MEKISSLSDCYTQVRNISKKTIIIAVMFLWFCNMGAQEITGVVCDKTTKLPVSNVSVYLNGTSFNTVTNNLGRFELTPKSIFNTKLVLHHLSYGTTSVDNPFEGLPDTLYIEERVETLQEVIVYADRFTREQKMKAFREQFLGVTRAGKLCTILNESDIQLVVNMQTRRLLAFSDKPIVVVNNYLGYKVTFILVDFWTQYGFSIVSLNNDYVQSSYFAVTSSFTDLAPDNRRIKRRRDNIYELSSNYFFKSFANNTLTDNKFMLFNKAFPIDHRQYFAMKDTLSYKMISFIPDTDINKKTAFYSGSKLSGIISVLYRRRTQSDIFFMTDSFLIDRYGNIDNIDKISFSGQMGKNRAGDMLPIDYELTTSNEITSIETNK